MRLVAQIRVAAASRGAADLKPVLVKADTDGARNSRRHSAARGRLEHLRRNAIIGGAVPLHPDDVGALGLIEGALLNEDGVGAVIPFATAVLLPSLTSIIMTSHFFWFSFALSFTNLIPSST